MNSTGAGGSSSAISISPAGTLSSNQSTFTPGATSSSASATAVEEFITAQLTSETRQEILQRLFREWLNGELNYWLNPYNLGEQENE